MSTENAIRQQEEFSRLPQKLREAVTAHQSGKLQEAYPLYREFLQGNPEHPMGLQLCGLMLSQLGDYPRAIAFMQESLRLFPKQPEVLNNLGNALSRAERRDEAIGAYQEAIRLEPRYVDAHRNLGRCYLRLGRLDEAEASFRRCVELDPNDAPGWLGLGNVHQRREDYETAIPCYDKALAARAGYAQAHHNKGLCLRMMIRPQEALEEYRRAAELGLDRPELHLNTGNALIDVHDVEGAIAAYRRALERNPLDTESHRNLNTLLWQQEQLDDYLGSYRRALADYPAAEPLRQAYAMALAQQEDFAGAERVLREGLAETPESPELKSLLAYSLEGQDRWDEALAMHGEAVVTTGSVPNHRISYARALLACRRPEEALEQAKPGAALMPFNQRALAYLGLCWRMLGDKRDAYLNDYENLVGVYELPVPPGYANIHEFNERLAQVLDGLHIGKRHPAEQTLRGGSQTMGDLFSRSEPEIRELVASLRQCIADYISRFPDNPEHPLFSRRSEGFDFAASWSVRLARGGFHTMHTHPLGWISSAYYVQVPEEVSESDAHGGGIKFGEPDIDIGEHGQARRRIQPQVGRLVLFPSYMWHGTVPFESDAPRMTVAFDVVPEN
ncbi:MAG TPA: tetratricopeptide repeat protein [Woeseiaceae bacterium]|nr:tetratricopeptide repeat protein [Woeseiaceae bacterium]